VAGAGDQVVADRVPLVKFEKVLRYADFPSLDLNLGDSDIKGVPKEIFDMLLWRQKGRVSKGSQLLWHVNSEFENWTGDSWIWP
jgi:hypothetical protein